MPTLHQNVVTSHIDAESLPWVPFTPYSDEVLLKYFKVDPVRGEVVAGFRMPAGADMAAHYHTGTVVVYTVRGSWRYLEHDWISQPGDVVYETAASSHKPVVVGDEEVETITITTGELLFLDDAGAIIARENAKTSLERYEAYCQANGLEVHDLTSFEEER
jgi:quercetin dioxygenase-like cupin family protein